MSITNKICTIIGVGPGIGWSVAKKFAKNGFTLAICSRNQDKLDKYLSELNTINKGNHIAVPMDASDPVSIEQGFKTIKSKLGNTDLLVYNASTFKYGSIEKVSADDFLNCFKSNCLGAFVSSQQVLPGMVEKKQGAILFTGATAALRGSANFAAFSTGKFALRSLCQSIAREYAPKGIHAAIVHIDGQVDINRDYSQRPKEEFLDPDAIADTYYSIFTQDKSAWTLELELRPNLEKF
ncbi:short chain dehydrogenase [Tieghemostelium lacteum]|uniref:Short chain dehydrogenase n=1 Tax=Tieghemostelium lacteum TaxID=361077 RepID=A0A152A9T5_TIELA|nr:short chain dehydrogenase [Tieghemostelium lacteum]|eukprot:KYR02980.1 short chain dehydrogenase [Tieghemostelium lacteum]